MKFSHAKAEIYVPDGTAAEAALARTTRLSVGAHQDDLEIMDYAGIVECFGVPDRWFCGVVVTDGAGSARTGIYADTTDEQMQDVRALEQKKAAYVGEYGAQILLRHPSSAVKNPSEQSPIDDLEAILKATRPDVVTTHQFADKHDTHVGVTWKLLRAIRRLPKPERPRKLFGCEVWRNLDWMLDEDKVAFDVSARPNLANALVAIFDSQISGGKRYDSATAGRRLANATYFASHGVDDSDALSFGVDMTPLIEDDTIEPAEFVGDLVRRFADDVQARVERFR